MGFKGAEYHFVWFDEQTPYKEDKGMRTIALEIRDRMTFIPVLATSIEPTNDANRYLIRRSGFGPTPRYVLVTRINDGEAKSNFDYMDWDNRTMCAAHIHIENNFDTLVDGDVIDVEFVLGETATKKESERYA